MPPELPSWELFEVLMAFFFWLSVFVALAPLVAILLLGVSIWQLVEGQNPGKLHSTMRGVLILVFGLAVAAGTK